MSVQLKQLRDLDVKGKKVLCRVDLNVPMRQGRIEDMTRIERVLPTIRYLIKQGAKVILLSHFGRPRGKFVREMSLAPLVDAISDALDGKDIAFTLDCVGEEVHSVVDAMQNGDVVLLENLRFHAGEETNNSHFVQELASLGDVFVNDTLSCSHRKHASIVGLARHLPSAAGLLLQEEVENLEKVLSNPVHPMAAVVGGSKVSTKIGLLNSLIKKAEVVFIGGAMANTFIKAQGHDVGQSLYETDHVDTAKDIIEKAKSVGCELMLPSYVVVAKAFEEGASCEVVPVDAIPNDMMALDVGPVTLARLTDRMEDMKTVIWNGPLGAFECRPFDVGTISIARAIAALTRSKKMVSVAGGGDVVAALGCSGLTNSFSYISTAGGAFLEWLEGKSLPGIEVLLHK